MSLKVKMVCGRANPGICEGREKGWGMPHPGWSRDSWELSAGLCLHTSWLFSAEHSLALQRRLESESLPQTWL